ncbi:MAG: hypothetical protein GVY16_02470 [Planctomycetes bacterium]|jgi:inner membrane protein|nr:metal-dependent hydrolase [Phycisphaerae bacterium]NBB94582.1 hypothetical protein [Planctomycetota bacterium]
MDTITQGLFGAAVAQVGFRDRIGRETGWVAAWCAASPDLDVFTSRVMDALGRDYPLSHLVYHRGVSHSLLAIPVIALLFAGPWWIIRRGIARRQAAGNLQDQSGAPPPFWLLYLCCFLAAATHGLLDAFTSYGTQLLWPITRTRYAWDSIPIIDLFITPLFIIGLIACYVIRRLPMRRRQLAASSVAAASLLLVMGYIGTGRVMHDRAIHRAMTTLGDAERQTVLQADAYPAIGHIFLWRVVIETPDEWIATRVHHFSRDLPTDDEQSRVAKQAGSPWIRRATTVPEYSIYDWFAAGRLRPVYAHDESSGLHVVLFHDMRYAAGTSGVESLWPLAVEMNADGRILSVHRTHPRRDGDFGTFVAMVWQDMWTP